MRHRRIKSRTFAVSLLVIFVLVVWLKNTYDDKSWVESDLELYKISSAYKDTSLMNMGKKIDSLNGQIKKLKTPIIVYVPIKPVYKPKIDSLPKVDTIDVTGPETILEILKKRNQTDTLVE